MRRRGGKGSLWGILNEIKDTEWNANSSRRLAEWQSTYYPQRECLMKAKRWHLSRNLNCDILSHTFKTQVGYFVHCQLWLTTVWKVTRASVLSCFIWAMHWLPALKEKPLESYFLVDWLFHQWQGWESRLIWTKGWNYRNSINRKPFSLPAPTHQGLAYYSLMSSLPTSKLTLGECGASNQLLFSFLFARYCTL